MNFDPSTRSYCRSTWPLPGCPSEVPVHRPTKRASGASVSAGAADCAWVRTTVLESAHGKQHEYADGRRRFGVREIADIAGHESGQRADKHAWQDDLKVVTILADRGKRAQDKARDQSGPNPERRGSTPASYQARDETGPESLQR